MDRDLIRPATALFSVNGIEYPIDGLLLMQLLLCHCFDKE